MDPLDDLPQESRNELVAAVRDVLDTDPDTAEDLIRASEPLWEALEQAGAHVIYGVIGRQIAPEKRSWAMGVAAAAGSFGQFLMVPVEGFLISAFGWQEALLVLAVFVLLVAPLALGLREPGFGGSAAAPREQTIGQALREAFGYRSFQLLMAGYFVCGFQVVFIGVHMPSYLKDHGLSPQVASYALAIIGLFNVIGTYAAGTLGQRLDPGFLRRSVEDLLGFRDAQGGLSRQHQGLGLAALGCFRIDDRTDAGPLLEPGCGDSLFQPCGRLGCRSLQPCRLNGCSGCNGRGRRCFERMCLIRSDDELSHMHAENLMLR